MCQNVSDATVYPKRLAEFTYEFTLTHSSLHHTFTPFLPILHRVFDVNSFVFMFYVSPSTSSIFLNFFSYRMSVHESSNSTHHIVDWREKKTLTFIDICYEHIRLTKYCVGYWYQNIVIAFNKWMNVEYTDKWKTSSATSSVIGTRGTSCYTLMADSRMWTRSEKLMSGDTWWLVVKRDSKWDHLQNSRN